MSRVRFAILCDHCGKRGPEYAHGYICRFCKADTCSGCMVPGSQNDETGECMCLHCDDVLCREGEHYDGTMAAQMLKGFTILVGVGIVLLVVLMIRNHVTPWGH